MPDRLRSLLDMLNPSSVIVTGGEPLLCDKKLYEDLLSFGKWNISFTTNLKDFYNRPQYWSSIFKNDRVAVCTSFQYGEGRCWSKGVPYTEQMFEDIARLYRDEVKKPLMFIAVISNENEQYAMKHLELAKQLGLRCKLNGVLPLGRSNEFFPRWKLLKIWLDAIDAGYGPWLDHQICTERGGCGFNTNCLCQSTIRACAFTKDGKLLYAECEEDLNAGGPYIEVENECPNQIPTKIPVEELVSKKCLFCKFCRLCNGCKWARKAAKLDPLHCQEMKKLEQRIVSKGWCL